jgi:hypothetical protein
MQSGAVGLHFCNVRTMWCIFKHCNLVDGQAMQTGSFSSNAFYSCVKLYVPILDGLAFRQARNEKEGNGIVYLANLCVMKY